MCEKTRSTPPWSELPPEMLQLIGEFTGNPIYQIQFRAVCKSWRSALGMVENRGIKNFPLKIPYHPALGYTSSELDIRNNEASLFIVLTTTYVIQPTKRSSYKGPSFLVTADEINPGFLSPRYPLSDSHCGAWWLRNQCQGFDLLDDRVRVLEIGLSVRLLHARRNASEKDNGRNELRHALRGNSRKAIVLSNPCCEDDLLIVVLCCYRELMSLRAKEGGWKVLLNANGQMCWFADIVKFKEAIYAIDHQGRAFSIDYDYESGDRNTVAVTPALRDSYRREKRLVVDSSFDQRRLYMVVQMARGPGFGFFVYKLNEDEGVWEKVKNIGNRMFFVGVNVSFCATRQDFAGLSMSRMRLLSQNCIFFSKVCFAGSCRNDDRVMFGINKEGNGMNNIGQYYLGKNCATGILEPAFVTMFCPRKLRLSSINQNSKR